MVAITFKDFSLLSEQPRLVAILFGSIFFGGILVKMALPTKKSRKINKFPGPRSFPLIGNAKDLMFPPDEIFGWLEGMKKKWGDVVRVWVFGNPKIFVNSYDVAMELLSQKTFLLKSEEFEPLRPVGGHSLAGASPEMHAYRRKLLGPGFTRQVVDNSLELFCRHARKFHDSLLEKAETGEGFDVLPLTSMCAYKVGCELAIGHENYQDIWETWECQKQIEAWHTLLVHLVDRSFKPWLKPDFIFNMTSAGKEVTRCYETINKFASSHIFLRRQRWEFLKTNRFSSEINLSNKVYDSSTPEMTCFLDLLLHLQDRKELTPDEVLHDLNIFIVAGYDTTGTTLAWTLHLLSQHPEVQEKCMEEILHVLSSQEPPSSSKSSPIPPNFASFPTIFSLIFAKSPLPLTHNHVKSFKYLEYCIKEALRLYPVLPWLLRRTSEKITLADNRVIPSHVDVPINTFLINRDPKYFPDPEKFNPDRYATDSSASKQLPFGAGPRICPGIQFAMTEMKVILAHLLLAFKWESAEEESTPKRVLFHGVLRPENGVRVKISKRH